MRRRTRLLQLFVMCMAILGITLCSTGCKEKTEQKQTNDMEKMKIGVAVYNNEDQEVIAFRKYFEDYVAKCFEVDFLYSNDIASAQDELDFVKVAQNEGVKGIISFVSYDLAGTVKACEDAEMYYVMGSGTVSQEAFEQVEDNPCFLGVIGPNEKIEREAGSEMADYFAVKDQEKKNHYLIISGGGADGNVMHQYRTEAILNTLAGAYGIIYDSAVEKLAVTHEVLQIEQNGVSIAICPGYIRKEEISDKAARLLEEGDYSTILSVLPLTDFYDKIESARKEKGVKLQVGVIDCFTEANLDAVDRGNLQYVTGKYPAMVGPSFAVMYNAITGYGEDFRDNGEAFQLEQGFWTASDEESYRTMYGLATGIYENAYNHEDLCSIMKDYTPKADFESLKTMTEAYSLEAVKGRRG